MAKLEYLYETQHGEINAPWDLVADYALIYRGDATTEQFKPGDIIYFRKGISNKDFETDNLLFLAKVSNKLQGTTAQRLGRIAWHEYDFTFTPIDGDRMPITSSYFKANQNTVRVNIIARAVNCLSAL